MTAVFVDTNVLLYSEDSADADELCYLVRAITPGGFLLLANGQGWERTTSMRNAFTIGQRVRVLARAGELPGVIASATGHIATLALPEPRELTWNDFWVDTGLARDELLARGVTPGTRVIWDAATVQHGPHVVGKALDDRVPLAVITEDHAPSGRTVPAAAGAAKTGYVNRYGDPLGLKSNTWVVLLRRDQPDHGSARPVSVQHLRSQRPAAVQPALCRDGEQPGLPCRR